MTCLDLLTLLQWLTRLHGLSRLHWLTRKHGLARHWLLPWLHGLSRLLRWSPLLQGDLLRVSHSLLLLLWRPRHGSRRRLPHHLGCEPWRIPSLFLHHG